MENIFKETVVLVVRVGEMSYGTGTGVRCTGYEEKYYYCSTSTYGMCVAARNEFQVGSVL